MIFLIISLINTVFHWIS